MYLRCYFCHMFPSRFYIYSKNKSENGSINVLSSGRSSSGCLIKKSMHVDNPLQTSLPLTLCYKIFYFIYIVVVFLVVKPLRQIVK